MSLISTCMGEKIENPASLGREKYMCLLNNIVLRNFRGEIKSLCIKKKKKIKVWQESLPLKYSFSKLSGNLLRQTLSIPLLPPLPQLTFLQPYFGIRKFFRYKVLDLFRIPICFISEKYSKGSNYHPLNILNSV